MKKKKSRTRYEIHLDRLENKMNELMDYHIKYCQECGVGTACRILSLMEDATFEIETINKNIKDYS